jgi:cobalt-zinc-cadmium efflux system outer membrane protein
LKRNLSALLLLLWAPSRAIALPSAPPPDPSTLLQEAEESSPLLRAAQARLEAARHTPSQAEAPPDPEVSLSYTNDGLSQFTLGESEFSALSLSWTQEVRRSAKRKQAGELAQRSADVAEKDVERVRREVRSEVKQAYAELFRLDRTSAILQEIGPLLESLVENSRRRYEVGEGVQESVLKAQTETLLLEAEASRVEQDRRIAEARLNAAVGREASIPIGPATIPLSPRQPLAIDTLEEASVSQSAEIGTLEAEVFRRTAGAELARQEEKPDFTWSASYQYRGGLDPMVVGLFGVRLPLHKDRKQAEAIAQAESDLQAARQELAALQVSTRSRVRELCARGERSQRLLTLYRTGILPQAETTLESARSSYAVGRLGFLDLLSDVKSLLQARLDEVSLEADQAQALAAMEPLVGRELLKPSTDDSAGGGDASLR